jgi:hypothetical protein
MDLVVAADRRQYAHVVGPLAVVTETNTVAAAWDVTFFFFGRKKTT